MIRTAGLFWTCHIACLQLERDAIFGKFAKRATMAAAPGVAPELGPPHSAISEEKSDIDYGNEVRHLLL